MDWNTPLIINESENIEKPNEESVQFNQAPETIEKDTDSCSSLFEDVLNKFQFYGQKFFLLQWFKLITTDNFPFGSICFILFTEFVQWLSQKSTTAMRYSEQSKEFWWTGKMLFGGKFLLFMEGFKHKGSIIHGVSQKGCFDPLDTVIKYRHVVQPFWLKLNIKDCMQFLYNHIKSAP